MTEVDADLGIAIECAEIGLLPCALAGVGGAIGNQGREVADAVNLVLGHEVLTQREQIEPPIWRTLQTAIVEVESVDVEIGPHLRRLSPIGSKAVNVNEVLTPKKQRPRQFPDAASTLAPKHQGG